METARGSGAAWAPLWLVLRLATRDGYLRRSPKLKVLMSDRSFREPRRHGSSHDLAPHRPRGHTAPTLGSAGRQRPISRPPVGATVKWFSPEKGFGFVVLDDGSGDAFLHASVIEQAGRDLSSLKPGATLQVTIGHGQKGAQVTELLKRDESTSSAATARRGMSRVPGRAVPERIGHMTGIVKWYSAERGFGFVAVEDGRREVFVHASALRRSRIATLSEGQRVTLEVAEGRKGLEAVAVGSAS
jgi:cold shock protein